MTQTLNLATVSEVMSGMILTCCAVAVFDKAAWFVCVLYRRFIRTTDIF